MSRKWIGDSMCTDMIFTSEFKLHYDWRADPTHHLNMIQNVSFQLEFHLLMQRRLLFYSLYGAPEMQPNATPLEHLSWRRSWRVLGECPICFLSVTDRFHCSESARSTSIEPQLLKPNLSGEQSAVASHHRLHRRQTD